MTANPIYPHSRIFVGQSTSVVISGPHIQVLDSTSGDILRASQAFDEAPKAALVKSGPIRCVAVDGSTKYIATCSEDKVLKVWSLPDLNLLSQRELPKRPTELLFTGDSQTILTADKFGDVFSYPLVQSTDINKEEQKGRDVMKSHDNGSGGELVLGHTSLLSACTLTHDGKYIVTADRDEHIRVSWYPQGYTIETYCLGHEHFISALHIPEYAPAKLISGGGDPTLKFWDWMSGELTREIEVRSIVLPTILVKPQKNERPDPINDTKRFKKRRRKAKDKLDKEAEESLAVNGEEADMFSTDPIVNDVLDQPLDPVLLIQKIVSVQSNGENFVIFSALGSTALFSILESDGQLPNIDVFDLRAPVLDFTVTSDGSIWTSLDSRYNELGETLPEKPTPVHRLRISDRKLIEELTPSPLLTSLNTSCLFSVSLADLETLDLYGNLTSMPKNAEAEYNPMDQSTPPIDENSSSTKRQGKRFLARQRQKEVIKSAASGPAFAVPSPVSEPERKRTKVSDS